jgi:hypothetical protein
MAGWGDICKSEFVLKRKLSTLLGNLLNSD